VTLVHLIIARTGTVIVEIKLTHNQQNRPHPKGQFSSRMDQAKKWPGGQGL